MLTGVVLDAADVKIGQSCAIVGLGGVGLTGLMAALAAGADPVIAVDLSEEKRDFARDLGTHHTIDPSGGGAAQQFRDWTGGGVDVAVELAGASATLRFAYDIASAAGLP